MLGLSLDQVSERTGIKLKFLESLEDGNFRQLPPDVYVLGFLRQLAELYSIEEAPLSAQYKKEKNIHTQIEKRAHPSRAWASVYFSRLVVTPKFLSIVLGLLFVVMTLGYIIWQVASINKLPSLEIFEPQDRQVIKDSFVNVRGKTDPDMKVTINSQDVFVDSSGNFKLQLSMEVGPKQLEVTASNKFGKTVTKIISITGTSDVVASSSPVSLKLGFSENVILSFSIDDAPRQVLDFYKGDTKFLSGQKKIVISTSNAGATTATLNGQNLGSLGRSGEQLSNVPFFAESGSASSSK